MMKSIDALAHSYIFLGEKTKIVCVQRLLTSEVLPRSSDRSSLSTGLAEFVLLEGPSTCAKTSDVRRRCTKKVKDQQTRQMPTIFSRAVTEAGGSTESRRLDSFSAKNEHPLAAAGESTNRWPAMFLTITVSILVDYSRTLFRLHLQNICGRFLVIGIQ
jgi:hypothetical protein